MTSFSYFLSALEPDLNVWKDPVYRTIIIAAISVAAVSLIYFIYCALRSKYIDRLFYTRYFSEKGSYEGDEILLIETLHNKSFLPLFFINIEYYIYNQLQYDGYELPPDQSMQYTKSRFFVILPFMQIRRKHKIKLLKRGFYSLNTITLSYARHEIRLSAPASVYIYPALMKTTELPIPASSLQGDVLSRNWLIRDPFSVSGIREYRLSDPFNSINFKATARSGRFGIEGIRVNNRDFCSNRNIMIYLNFQMEVGSQIPYHYYEKMMEKGLSYSASTIREAFDYGYCVGFAANASMLSGETYVYYPMTQGAVNYEEILRQMSLINVRDGGISFSSLLKNDALNNIHNSEIIVITTYINEAIEKEISSLEKLGNSVTTVMLGDIHK